MCIGKQYYYFTPYDVKNKNKIKSIPQFYCIDRTETEIPIPAWDSCKSRDREVFVTMQSYVVPVILYCLTPEGKEKIESQGGGEILSHFAFYNEKHF